MGALFGCLALLVSFPFLIIYGTWAWAVVLKSVWAWYIVPAFALQPITFTQAVAISAIVNLFFIKAHIAEKVKTDSKDPDDFPWGAIIGTIVTAFLAPWVTWIIYWFIQAIFI
jgi:hypothetical protein